MIEENIRSIHFQALMNGWLPPEKVELRFNSSYDSAAWSYMPPHKIIIGGGIEKRCTGSLQESLSSYIYHELAHAHWTDKDITNIRKILQAECIPFSLFNLFEDARVENLWRKATSRRFNWSVFELPVARPENALDYFFALVQNEGETPIFEPEPPSTAPLRLKYMKVIGRLGIKPFLYNDTKRGKQFSYYDETNEVKNYFGDDYDYEIRSKSVDRNKPLPYGKNCYEGEITVVHRRTEESFTIKSDMPCLESVIKTPRVTEYYERTLQANNTLELVAICKEWLAEFPQERKITNQQATKDNITLDESDFMMLEGSSTLLSGDETGRTKCGGFEGNPKPVESSHNPDSMLGGSSFIDISEVNRLVPIFERILKKSYVKTSTESPQKRINIRNYILGNPKIYRKKTKSTQSSRKSVSIIVDCSGSMEGNPIQNGKLLLTVINELAKKGKINGYMILSKINYQDVHEYAVFRFPVADGVIPRIDTDGDGEGFYSTLERTKKFLSETDYTFVYTDGYIGDEHRDKSENHLKGIFTYGLYAGQKDVTETLMQFFDCCISRNSAAELINSLIEKIK